MVGSSVNFTWSFTGDVRSVSWGLKHDRIHYLRDNGALVELRIGGPVPLTVPSAYNGRVSGRGDVSSGQVIFTLSSIRHSDERFYGCLIRSNVDFESPRFDDVRFVVEGGCEKIVAYNLFVHFFFSIYTVASTLSSNQAL